MIKQKVTIDLDIAKMDLRLALGTDIIFMEECNDLFTCKVIAYVINNSSSYVVTEIVVEDEYGDARTSQYALKLCPDYLKRIGVGVEE